MITRPKTNYLPTRRLRKAARSTEHPSIGGICIFTACQAKWAEVWREGLLKVLGFTGPKSIFDWNDDSDRTWDEVIEKAIEAERYLGWRK